MKDKITGYDVFYMGLDKDEDNFLIPEWKLYLLYHTNHYAYFRLFKITYNTEERKLGFATFEEIKELKSNNKKKLKYSLRKDKTNWLGEIPCFKTSCISICDEFKITLPFSLPCENGILNIITLTHNVNPMKCINGGFGHISFDLLEKHMLEQKQKLEPPKQEEPKEEPQEDTVVSEESKIHEGEMNAFLQQLHNAPELFKGDERETILLGLINSEVEKQMLKLKSKLFNIIKKEVESDFNFICNNYKNGNI